MDRLLRGRDRGTNDEKAANIQAHFDISAVSTQAVLVVWRAGTNRVLPHHRPLDPSARLSVESVFTPKSSAGQMPTWSPLLRHSTGPVNAAFATSKTGEIVYARGVATEVSRQKGMRTRRQALSAKRANLAWSIQAARSFLNCWRARRDSNS